MSQANETLKLLEELVSIPSTTDTEGESKVEELVFEKLKKISKLKENNTLGLEKIENDLHSRSIVWGLLKGEGSETIILLNHHDVVSTFDYGNLQHLAYSPVELKKEMKKLNFSNDVMQDINSEDWMFGRGTADMKGGLAIQLKLLEKFSEKEHFKGNLLFLSVPDEENLSLGMRNSSRLLIALSKKYNLDYKLLINSEPHERSNDKFTIYDSSVGKTMAIVYAQGKKAHIGKVFEGLNPLSILSRIQINTELNSEFSDKEFGEISTPPSWSFARDFKEDYDASIPEAAGGYLSFLTLNSTPKKILKNLKNICQLSFEETIKNYKCECNKIFPNQNTINDYKPNVKLYEELYCDAIQKDRAKTEEIVSKCFEKIKGMLKTGNCSIPQCNFIMINHLLDFVDYKMPTVVVALSPPFYPHTTSCTNESYAKVLEVIDKISVNKEIEFKHYFMGISDLSYVGLQNENEIVPYVSKNMPLWQEGFYTVPFQEMKRLSMPTLIIGPWGKELHRNTERVYIPDLVENVPNYIEKLIVSLL